MIKEFIGTGATVEDAIAAAKTGLNAPAMASVSVEVIAMPKKKVLGLFGGKDAQVKAWYDDGVKERKPQPKKETPRREAAKKSEKKPPVKKEFNKKAETAAPAPKEQKKAEDVATESDINADIAVAYVKNILKGLNVDDAEITTTFKDGILEMEVECENYGIIIGRRGETLDSIQYLASLALKRSCEKSVRVNLNVGNYREKRTETLKSLAHKNANYVLRTGRRFTFEPMNPYERRVIHTTVQDIEGVESLSIGYGQERKVVIQPVGGVKPRQRRDSAPRREASSPSSAPAQKKVASKADRAFTKFGKIEVNKD